jgi:hypothetical protein
VSRVPDAHAMARFGPSLPVVARALPLSIFVVGVQDRNRRSRAEGAGSPPTRRM